MIFSAQMNRLLAFFKNGKAADTNIYKPDDVAAAMSANEAAYAAGISAKHIASGAFRILPFSGVDGSGETPNLACTLTGALAADTVAAVIDTADFSDQRSKFSSSTGANVITQSSLTDLHTHKYLALLIKA